MKDHVPDMLEKGRIRETDPMWHTDPGDWHGRFLVRGPAGDMLLLVVGPGDMETWESIGWPPPCFEHVSVSVRRAGNANQSADRCPTWEEMSFVKDLVWAAEECVIQYHPPRSEYVNCHPHCLHLWRPVGVELPRPPQLAVGIPDSVK